MTSLRSPVLVLTCNRVRHFTNLIESLARCHQASETELHVALDAPFDSSVREANEEIERYARSISGFARVHVHKRERNLGLCGNFNRAVEDVFKEHDTLIFLEDDNIVAEGFLAYMNAALARFREEPRCFAVCGYNLPVERPDTCPTDVFASPLVCAWGIGFFRDRYVRPDVEAAKGFDRFFLNPLNFLKIHRLSPPLFSMYVNMHLSRQEFPDVIFAVHTLSGGMFNIYPVDTKVMNVGFDGSGVHCDQSRGYLHAGFVNSDRSAFVVGPDERTNGYYLRVCARHVEEMYGRRWGGALYSYFLYLLCMLLGRDRAIRVRDYAKARLGRLIGGR